MDQQVDAYSAQAWKPQSDLWDPVGVKEDNWPYQVVLGPHTYVHSLSLHPHTHQQHHHHYEEEEERQLVMYKGPSGKLMEMRKNGTRSKGLEEKSCQPQVVSWAKLPFNNEGEMKTNKKTKSEETHCWYQRLLRVLNPPASVYPVLGWRVHHHQPEILTVMEVTGQCRGTQERMGTLLKVPAQKTLALFCFLFMYMGIFPVGVSMCYVHAWCLQSPCNWSYQKLWVAMWVLKPSLLAE